jgi:hypothetical protein
VLQHLEADGKVFELFAHFRADPPAPLPAVRASLLCGLQVVVDLDSFQTVGQVLPPRVAVLHAPRLSGSLDSSATALSFSGTWFTT